MMRKSKRKWMDTGIKILGEAGVKGLTIERMAEELNLTKGSFYHHFKDVRDFQEQLIAYWADQYLSTSSSLPDEPGDRMALLDQIMEQAFSPVTEPEVAIRAWAQQDEMVRAFVGRVDATRHAFVLQVFQSVTGDEGQARLMADLLFSIAIGSITALPRISPERVLELYKEFKRLYGLGD
jgi:AcrR family transcriptional regulator